MSLKLKPRLKTSIQSPPSEPPRNSFTSTDYYRQTREEYYSPISYIKSSSPGSPYADLPELSPTSSTRLAHIHEASEPDGGEANETGAPRVSKRFTASFWYIIDTLFRKCFRQK
ncbi:hypothetical protein B0H12DRAFT_1229743 [Mycena haematopus]|nr:hypothetical protein B0H12DRAFT_1229743 [Mycena haematopus]